MSSSSLKDRTWSQQQTQKLTRALARSTAVDQNIMRSPAPPPDVKACAVASDTGMADGTLDMEGEDVSEDPESSDAQAEALFES